MLGIIFFLPNFMILMALYGRYGQNNHTWDFLVIFLDFYVKKLKWKLREVSKVLQKEAPEPWKPVWQIWKTYLICTGAKQHRLSTWCNILAPFFANFEIQVCLLGLLYNLETL